MFALAMDARKRDAGVVGSTSNILEFIDAKVKEALDKPFPERVQVRAAAPEHGLESRPVPTSLPM